jgi:hypothetical protein
MSPLSEKDKRDCREKAKGIFQLRDDGIRVEVDKMRNYLKDLEAKIRELGDAGKALDEIIDSNGDKASDEQIAKRLEMFPVETENEAKVAIAASVKKIRDKYDEAIVGYRRHQDMTILTLELIYEMSMMGDMGPVVEDDKMIPHSEVFIDEIYKDEKALLLLTQREKTLLSFPFDTTMGYIPMGGGTRPEGFDRFENSVVKHIKSMLRLAGVKMDHPSVIEYVNTLTNHDDGEHIEFLNTIYRGQTETLHYMRVIDERLEIYLESLINKHARKEETRLQTKDDGPTEIQIEKITTFLDSCRVRKRGDPNARDVSGLELYRMIRNASKVSQDIDGKKMMLRFRATWVHTRYDIPPKCQMINTMFIALWGKGYGMDLDTLRTKYDNIFNKLVDIQSGKSNNHKCKADDVRAINALTSLVQSLQEAGEHRETSATSAHRRFEMAVSAIDKFERVLMSLISYHLTPEIPGDEKKVNALKPEHGNNKQRYQNQGNNSKEMRRCYRCKEQGHLIKDCTQPPKQENELASSNGASTIGEEGTKVGSQ